MVALICVYSRGREAKVNVNETEFWKQGSRAGNTGLRVAEVVKGTGLGLTVGEQWNVLKGHFEHAQCLSSHLML